MSLRRNVHFFAYKEVCRFLQPSRWLVESIIKDIGVDRTPVLLSGTAVNGSSLLDDYEAELKITADFGGLGFAQNIIIHDGKEQPLFRRNTFQYRALCELEGRICIIQSDAPMPYRNYVDMLNALGVRHAIYLDMGGWNHSWYRVQAQEGVTYIRKNPHSAYTNWLTFYL